jgi:hypothetical protein
MLHHHFKFFVFLVVSMATVAILKISKVVCTSNGFEAWKFQNACRCHGNRKNTKFNTKVNNNLLGLRNFKMATIAMEIIFEFTA